MKKTIKSWLIVGCAAGLALSLHSEAKAQSLPQGTFTIAGNKVDISSLFTWDPQSSTYIIAPGTQVTDPNSGMTIQLGVTADPDPVLTYSFAASNFTGGPVPFAVDFQLPINTPIAAGSPVFASLGITMTDALGNGVKVTPNSAFPFNAGFIQNAGGDNVDFGLDLGTTFSKNTGKPASTFTTNFSGSGVTPFQINNFMFIHLAFLLSGNFDTASFTGAVVITEVPEPGSIALLAGLSLSGSAFLLRRNRNRKRAA